MVKPTKAQQNGTSPLDAAYMRVTGVQHHGNQAVWSEDADYSAIGRALAAFAELGVAVQLGRTRDGGALSVRLYGVGDGKPRYFATDEQAIGWLELVVELAGAL